VLPKVASASNLPVGRCRFERQDRTSSSAAGSAQLAGVSAGCRQMRTRTTMTHMAMVYRRPVGVMRQSVKPQLASWDRAGHPSQVKLARFLAYVDGIAGPVLATVSGRVAAELIVGFSDGASLIEGGHDLDNYLFPVAQRLGPERVAAIFGRKIHGPSSLAVGPAQPDTAEATPQFSTRMAGSYERREWKQKLHDRLAVQAATIDPGPVGLKIALTTGPGRKLGQPLEAAHRCLRPRAGRRPHPAVPPARGPYRQPRPASHHRHRHRPRRDHRRLVDPPVANPAASRHACHSKAGPNDERTYVLS